MRNDYRSWLLGLTLAVCALLTTAGSASAYTLKTLYSFCSQPKCRDGITPNALTMDPAGNLYGAATYGGVARRKGVIFELSPNADKSAWTFAILYQFCKGCIVRPEGRLVLDTAGNLYGVTRWGGPSQGAVFELSPNAGHTSWTLTTLHEFKFCKKSGCVNTGYEYLANALAYAGSTTGALYDGISPLYGTTSGAGADHAGFAFQLVPKNGQFDYQVIFDFCTNPGCDGGGISYAPAYVDPQGNVFVTTVAYSQSGGGGIIELTPGPDGKFNATALHSFSQGSFPTAAMIPDAQGNLYGTTQLGGSSNQGVVYKLTPNGSASQYSVLYSFCPRQTCDDGRDPSAGSLTIDAAGNIFGSTKWGGTHHNDPITSGGGTVFELNGSRQTLYDFCAAADCSDGQEPTGSLAMDSQGNLFGTTNSGGRTSERAPLGAGTIFELMP